MWFLLLASLLASCGSDFASWCTPCMHLPGSPGCSMLGLNNRQESSPASLLLGATRRLRGGGERNPAAQENEERLTEGTSIMGKREYWEQVQQPESVDPLPHQTLSAAQHLTSHRPPMPGLRQGAGQPERHGGSGRCLVRRGRECIEGGCMAR